MMATEDRFISVDGTRIRYREAGRGERVVALVHGFLGSAFSWRHNLAPLAAAGYRVLAPDLRGFGLSGKPAGGDYSRPAQARLLAGFLTAAGVERAHVTGHSMGASVALHLAAAYPDRVTTLTLVTPAGERSHRFPSWLARLSWLLLAWTPGAVGAALRRVAAVPGCVTGEMVAGYTRPLRTPGMAGALAAMSRVPVEPDPVVINRPVLIILGERDPLVSVSAAKALAAVIPGAGVALIAGAGHLPQETHPATFNRLLLAFLAGRDHS